MPLLARCCQSLTVCLPFQQGKRTQGPCPHLASWDMAFSGLRGCRIVLPGFILAVCLLMLLQIPTTMPEEALHAMFAPFGNITELHMLRKNPGAGEQ